MMARSKRKGRSARVEGSLPKPGATAPGWLAEPARTGTVSVAPLAVEPRTHEITMKLSGGCNCGQVRYELDGDPIRVGICHCETCRKTSGSAFSFFGIWPRTAAALTGRLACWQSRAGGERFCPTCGSALFCWEDDSGEIEIKLGTLDSPPSGLVPAYELWTIRREPWLTQREGAEQHGRDRPVSSA